MTDREFQPDYRHVLDAAHNRRPARLPIYEHYIEAAVAEKVLGLSFAPLLQAKRPADVDEFFRQYARFFKEMTYDTVSFEVCITRALPETGAIMGGRPGPIQSRRDFAAFPWDDIPRRYWEIATPQFDGLARQMPPGMLADDPQLVGELFVRIGDVMVTIWQELLRRYGRWFALCRFGDDLGFKTSTLLAPATIVQHVLPQHRRIVDCVHAAGGTFLLHCCGNIFDIMDAEIALGIDAKHSNEDAIAPFERWIELYGQKIGLFGGIDVDLLVRESPDEISRRVIERGSQFRRQAKGFALGSGNSIPDYVPVESYLAMIDGAKEIRRRELRQP